MKLETLRDLYFQELQDLHSAEMQVKSALPNLIKGATDIDLKEGLKAHLKATLNHVERLNEILKHHGAKRQQDKCKGMEGVLAECAEMLEIEGDATIRDLGIISACQRMQHYEMAGYGNVRTLAARLGEEDDAELLSETFEEESAADDEFTSVATILLSRYEIQEPDEEEEDDDEGEEASNSDPVPIYGRTAARAAP